MAPSVSVTVDPESALTFHGKFIPLLVLQSCPVLNTGQWREGGQKKGGGEEEEEEEVIWKEAMTEIEPQKREEGEGGKKEKMTAADYFGHE